MLKPEKSSKFHVGRYIFCFLSYTLIIKHNAWPVGLGTE